MMDRANMPEVRSRVILSSVFEALGPLFHHLSEHVASLSGTLESTLTEYVRYVFDVQDEVEQIRTKAAEAAAEMALVVRKGRKAKDIFADALSKRRVSERSKGVQQILELAWKSIDESMTCGR